MPAGPDGVVRWLSVNLGDLAWLIALVLGIAGWLTKRLRTGRPDAAARWRGSLPASLRLAAAPMQAGVPAPRPARGSATGAASPSGHAPRPVPAPRAAAAAPGERGRVHRPEDEPELRSRPPLLDAFRDPAGARTAVILAEILAPPVGLR